MVNSNQKSKREGRRRREEGEGGGEEEDTDTATPTRLVGIVGVPTYIHMRVHRQPRSPLRSLQQYLDYIHSIVHILLSTLIGM